MLCERGQGTSGCARSLPVFGSDATTFPSVPFTHSCFLHMQVHWLYKNKEQGKTAAAASLGLITLWDVEGGLPQIDKYLYSKARAGLHH